jgi:hypothetical protein
MAVDIQWANFSLVPSGGATLQAASALKRDSSGVDFALAPGAYVAPFLDSLNPGGLAAMDVVVPPGGCYQDPDVFFRGRLRWSLRPHWVGAPTRVRS